jgi:hypothetical protein
MGLKPEYRNGEAADLSDRSYLSLIELADASAMDRVPGGQYIVHSAKEPAKRVLSARITRADVPQGSAAQSVSTAGTTAAGL